MLVLLALLGLAWSQDCPRPATPTDVDSHVDDAMLAFATLDEQGVYDAADAASADLKCLDQVLTPAGAASYDRLIGIRAFMKGDTDQALVSFQAARALQPDYELSTRIAPEGGKLARLFAQAKTTADRLTVTFRAPREVQPYVDGKPSNQYSLEAPAILQYADDQGHVVWTGYL